MPHRVLTALEEAVRARPALHQGFYHLIQRSKTAHGAMSALRRRQRTTQLQTVELIALLDDPCVETLRRQGIAARLGIPAGSDA